MGSKPIQFEGETADNFIAIMQLGIQTARKNRDERDGKDPATLTAADALQAHNDAAALLEILGVLKTNLKPIAAGPHGKTARGTILECDCVRCLDKAGLAKSMLDIFGEADSGG